MKVNAEKRKEDNKVKKKSIAAVLSGFLALGLAVATAAAGKNATYTTAEKTWDQVDEKTWIQDQDGDGYADVTLIKNGDEWEYWFKVQDDQAGYYGWEEKVPDGYRVDGKGERKNPVTNTTAITKYSHTENVDDSGNQNGGYSDNLNTMDVVSIPGASSLHVKITYAMESVNYDWVCMWTGDAKAAGYTVRDYGSSKTGKLGGYARKTWESDIEGDTVTFGFRSDIKDNNYYGYYAVVTATMSGSDFSIINEKQTYLEPDYGSLKLSKVIAGTEADPTQNFRFDLQLSPDDPTLSGKLMGTTTYGDVTFADGKGIAYLKGGESVTMTKIPVGMKWEISEAAVDGYTTTVTGGTSIVGKPNTVTGKITKDTVQQITYTNTKDVGGNVPGTTETSSFKLKKIVENGNDSDTFTFSATLTGLKKSQTYPVSVTQADGTNKQLTVQTNAAGSAYLTFELKNNEIAEFQKLPTGCQYQIEEEASAYTASYGITDEVAQTNLNVVMSQKQNLEANQSLATQRETLDAGEKALILFTNRKPAPAAGTVNIAVRKLWEDDGNTAGIRPDAVTVQLYQSTDVSEQGDMIATAQLDKLNSWATEFKGLDQRTENGQKEYIYTVQEKPVAGYKGEVKKNSDGSFDIINRISGEATGDLKISKRVDTNHADTTEQFNFIVTLMKEGQPVKGTYRLDSAGGTKTGSVYFDENGQTELTLKADESAYIVGIPEGTDYQVQETSYYNWKPSLEEETAWNGTISSGTLAEVKVLNTYQEEAALTVRKTVRGDAGNQTEAFDFELTLTASGSGNVPNRLSCEKDGRSMTLVKRNGVYSFTLTHGEQIRIGDIPVGTAYAIKEVGATEKGYKIICDKLTGTLTQSAEVTVINEKNKPQDGKKNKTSHHGGSGNSGAESGSDGSISIAQNAKTGDTAPIGLLVGLIVLSAGMLVILNKIRRNKQK